MSPWLRPMELNGRTGLLAACSADKEGVGLPGLSLREPPGSCLMAEMRCLMANLGVGAERMKVHTWLSHLSPVPWRPSRPLTSHFTWWGTHAWAAHLPHWPLQRADACLTCPTPTPTTQVGEPQGSGLRSRGEVARGHVCPSLCFHISHFLSFEGPPDDGTAPGEAQ